MNEKKLSLLGYCGLYCGACNHYRASFSKGKHLLGEAVKQGKDPNGFTCGGCRGNAKYLHSGCDVCQIRLCAEKKGVVHCGICTDFPCEMLITFQNDGRHIHHLDVANNLKEVKSKGPEQWLKEQEEKWRCDCGMSFSWYEKECNNCGIELVSYATTLRPSTTKKM